jgi:divalent metal cation (Fe/Co/Zn/Cd) transporter
VLTVQLAPHQIVAALSLEFDDDTRAPRIENLVIRIERRVRQAHPEVVALFVKPQTHKVFAETLRRRLGDAEYAKATATDQPAPRR